MAYQQQGGTDLPQDAQAAAGAAREQTESASREAQGGAQATYGQRASAAESSGAMMAADEPSVGGWQLGFITFAGIMMIMSGIFHIFTGLGALIEEDFYELARAYAFDMSVNAWGWLHIVVGAVLILAGFYVFTGNIIARLIGIAAAFVSIIVNFAYMPYYEVWSILMIVVDIGVIWALATYSRRDAESLGSSGY
jgi:hypothetical protein